MDGIRWGKETFDLAGVVVAFALNFWVQSMVLIVAGLFAAWLLRRFGCSVQSAIHRATLIAVLACPLLSSAFSALGVSGWTLPTPPPRVLSMEEVDRSGSPPAGTILADRAKGLRPDSRRPEQGTRLPSSGASKVEFEAQDPDFRSEVHAETRKIHEQSISAFALSSASVFGWMALGSCLIWIACTASFLVRLTWAWRRLRRIRHAAIPLNDETQRVCDALSKILKVAPPPVLQTPFLPGPCLAGIFRPAILIPDWGRQLNRDDQAGIREILIHELSHLRRHDGLWNLLRQLSTASFFFQPLLWHLSRRLEITAEEVCDDWVVKLGADRQAYAHTLADVAEWSTVPMGGVSVAMAAKGSQLAERVARILDRSRPLSTSIGRLLAAGIAVVASMGAILVGMAGAGPSRLVQEPDGSTTNRSESLIDDKENQSPPRPENSSGTEGEDKSVPSIEKTAEAMIVRGVVRKPDGRPAKGAKVALRHGEWSLSAKEPLMVTAVTGVDGKFTITCRKPSDELTRDTDPLAFDITAQANGFGLKWISGTEIASAKALLLTLVPEVPIKGRIVDARGNPIAGIQVGVYSVTSSAEKGADLSHWLKAVKAGAYGSATDLFLQGYLTVAQEPPENRIRTDQDGRFTIAGIGPECLADLELRGETIAYQRVSVVTRAMEPLMRTLVPSQGWFQPPIRDRVFGADFTYTAVPTRIVEGTIRDAVTKQPLPEVTIESLHLAGMLFHPQTAVRTKTDAQGRFHLTGMPKGDGPGNLNLNEIQVLPGGQVPYLQRGIRLPKAKGEGPQTFDLDLHRGIWIRGRVTEKGTGKPVQARIKYFPLRENASIRDIPEFRDNDSQVGYEGLSVLTDREGRYRLPGLPGRGIVTASSVRGEFVHGLGAEKIPGRNESGVYAAFGYVPYPVDPRDCHALIEIDPKKEALEADCDFVLDPGQTVRVAVVDQESRPVPGCTMQSALEYGSNPSLSAELKVANLAPGETRDLVILQKERNLGKILKLTQKENGPQTISVTLEKCATIKGKVVDQEGKPFEINEVAIVVVPSAEIRFKDPPISVYIRPDGTFEYPYLPMGCKYYAVATSREEFGYDYIANKVEVKAGETVDIGVRKIKRKK